MRERAKVLLDRAPFYAVTRPLAGAAVGAAVGGLYGALCGACYAVLWGSLPVVFGLALHGAGAGAVAGFLMGLWSAADRAACGPAALPEPKPPRTAEPPANGRVARHADCVTHGPYRPVTQEGTHRGTV
jgi:hypothetical protein